MSARVPIRIPMHRFAHCALAVASCALFAAEAPAAVGPVGESGMASGRARVRARLVADVDALPVGGSAKLGIHYETDPGWHMYWRNPGDTGLPTEIDWGTPGLDAGPIEWPAPGVFSEGELFTAYGYEGEVLLASTVRFSPALVESDRIRIDVTTRFLVCEIQCVPGEIQLRREFPLLHGGFAPRPSDDAVLFAEAAARKPVTAEERGLEVAVLADTATSEPGAFGALLALRACPDRSTDCTPAGGARALFLPYEGVPFEIESTGLVEPTDPAIGDAAYAVRLRGEAQPRAPAEPRLRGLLALGGAARGAENWVEVDLEFPETVMASAAAAPPAPAPTAPPRANATKTAPGTSAGRSQAPAAGWAPEPDPRPISWLRVLGFALLGGLVLNLMPCVLPVLAIKVFAVTELAHAQRGEAVRHGAAYTAGVVLSMLALAGVVAGLREAGHAVGWGFQFQEPRFVAALSVVLVVFALNLMGVFEITFGAGRLGDVGASATGARRSFFEGLLAVVLATPCSAPFLATATGFAFAGSNLAIFAVFAAIGAGLAAPFALVALVPGLARLLPRPGAWMVQLRAGLGFLVFASVIWLLWIAGRTLGTDGVTTLLALLLAVAWGCWFFGTLQRSATPGATRASALALAVAGAIALAVVPLEPRSAAPLRAHAAEAVLPALPFDRASVEQSVAAGHPTFVYFTADWCITCKVNERRVLGEERVQAALAEGGFHVYRGDWTRRDETIRRELARHGRAGVPLYLVYDGNGPDAAPRLLPELLSVEETLAAFEQAAIGVRGELAQTLRRR